jgi:hypothetical protein
VSDMHVEVGCLLVVFVAGLAIGSVLGWLGVSAVQIVATVWASL